MGAAIRRSVAEARRIVVKVGSSSLTDAHGRIDMAHMNALVDTIAAARASDREVIVAATGAVDAGLHHVGMRV